MDALTSTALFSDGIYFGLDESLYHADPALGSTDTKLLADSPCDYWWTSAMNPDRPKRSETPSTILGTALHVLAFHGEREFDQRYMRGADNDDSMSSSEKSAATKAANKLAAERGLIALPAAGYDRIAIVAAKVLKNPDLAVAFSGGMPEVSVFWTKQYKDGRKVRKKGRFDYLKPRGIGDLKSVANQHQMNFTRACINNITNYDYHVQAKHYLDARAELPRLIRDGAVRGDCDAAFLKAITATTRYAWQWVFWQSERAPITWSYILSPANPICDIADAKIEKADQNFLEYMERFGENEMWLETYKPRELHLDDLPAYFARD